MLIVLLLLMGTSSLAEEPVKTVNCEKLIRIKLSQTSYTLNVWKHIRNAINAVDLTLPVSCNFYDSVQVGDDLLKKKFRLGSFIVHGSAGIWNLEVVEKL